MENRETRRKKREEKKEKRNGKFIKRQISKSLIAGSMILALTACGNRSTKSSSDRMTSTAAEVNYITQSAVNADSAAAGASYDEGYYESRAMADYSMEGDYESASAENINSELSAEVRPDVTDRKLITTMWMNVETNEMESLLSDLNTRIAQAGGYVEQSNINNKATDYRGNVVRESRTASLTIRVPEAHISELVNHVSDTTNILSSNSTVEDVTLTYVDMEARKEVYKAEEERLESMLLESQDIQTMVYIESRLTEVIAQRESLEAQLRSYDNRVSYGTIYLNISEVKEYTIVEEEEVEKTRWQVMSEGFMDSLEEIRENFLDFVQNTFINLPYILIRLAVLLIVILIVRLIVRKISKKFYFRKGHICRKAAAPESTVGQTEENKEE